MDHQGSVVIDGLADVYGGRPRTVRCACGQLVLEDDPDDENDTHLFCGDDDGRD